MGILVYIYTSLLQSHYGCYRLDIELPTILFFWVLAEAAELVSVVILVVYSRC